MPSGIINRHDEVVEAGLLPFDTSPDGSVTVIVVFGARPEPRRARPQPCPPAMPAAADVDRDTWWPSP